MFDETDKRPLSYDGVCTSRSSARVLQLSDSMVRSRPPRKLAMFAVCGFGYLGTVRWHCNYAVILELKPDPTGGPTFTVRQVRSSHSVVNVVNAYSMP